jgi:hypothetical protein
MPIHLSRRTVLAWSGSTALLNACGGGGSDATTATATEAATETETALKTRSQTRSFALKFQPSWQAGQYDASGAYMGGTELMRLNTFNGKLYATNGFFMDLPYGIDHSGDPWVGPQVLVKESARGPWQVEFQPGPNYRRIDSMETFTFTTSRMGTPITPTTLLLVSPSDWNNNPVQGRHATVWSRSVSGGWRKTVVETDSVDEQGPSARSMGDHVDRVTKVHHVFAGIHNGTAGGRIYKGSYDPSAPNRLVWDASPEIANLGGRVSGFAQANGVLYATVGLALDGATGAIQGGLYRRIDGSTPRWERVWQWTYQADAPTFAADEWNLVRGLTAVPDPSGSGAEVLIVGHAYTGNIYRINPAKRHAVSVEINIRDYFANQWGVSYPAGGKPSVIAHNQFTQVKHPDNGEKLWLFDVWVEKEYLSTTYPNNVAYHMVRCLDGSYLPHYTIDDPAHPVPNGRTLAGARTVESSPFAEDAGRVFYFGGYDVTGLRGTEHNTAWIYKGTLP